MKKLKYKTHEMRKNPPTDKRETIWEFNYRIHQEAKTTLILAKEMEAKKIKK